MNLAKISLSKAFVLIALSTLLNRVFTMMKDILVAREFGRDAEIEIFLLSYVIPYTIASILGGAIAAAFTPLFFSTKNRHDDFVRTAYLFTLIVGLIFSTALFFALPSILHYLNPNLANSIFSKYGTMPFAALAWFLIPNLISGLLAAHLNCLGRFSLPLLCFAISPLVSVITLWIFPGSITAFTFATLIGFILEASVLFIVAVWIKAFRFKNFWKFFDLTLFIKEAGLLVGGNLLNTSADLIDKTMVSTIGQGSVPALEYGSRIPWGIGNFVRTSIGNILLPRFSQQIAHGERRAARKELIKLTLFCSVGSLALSAVLFFASDFLISLIFERGAFQREDAQIVSAVQKILAFQLPFFICGALGMWMLMALQKEKFILIIAAVYFVINVSGNWFLMQTMGVIGICIATIVAYLVTAALSLTVSFRMLSKE